MTNNWKCYKVFTGTGFRFLMLFLFPVLFLAGNALVSSLLSWDIHLESTICSLLAEIEIMADYWFLSGICSKDTRQVEYLKSSVKGPEILRGILELDVFRRLGYMVAVNLLCWITTEMGAHFRGGQTAGGALSSAESLLIMLNTVLFYYIISMVGIFIGRYFGIFYIQLSIACVAGIVSSIVMAAIVLPMGLFIGITGSPWLWVLLGIMVLLAAGISVLNVWNVMMKVRESYYDK